MEEKKEVKVRLSTVVYVFIIVVLAVALGVVYYLGFVKEDNPIAKGEVTEKNNKSVNEQMPEVNDNIAEEKVEDNETEQGLKEYKGKEAIDIISKKDTKFVIESIKNNSDTYIISAYVLEKEPRKILEQEYKDILEGQEVTFRNIEWKYDKDKTKDYQSQDEIYLISTKDYNNENPDMIALRNDYEMQDERSKYFSNLAGVGANLCDFSNIKVEFEVSKDIKVCSFWGEFKYDNGKIFCIDINDETIELAPSTIDTLIEFGKYNEPGTCGTYEECIAYISNGKVDAIKIFEK